MRGPCSIKSSAHIIRLPVRKVLGLNPLIPVSDFSFRILLTWDRVKSTRSFRFLLPRYTDSIPQTPEFKLYRQTKQNFGGTRRLCVKKSVDFGIFLVDFSTFFVGEIRRTHRSRYHNPRYSLIPTHTSDSLFRIVHTGLSALLPILFRSPRFLI